MGGKCCWDGFQSVEQSQDHFSLMPERRTLTGEVWWRGETLRSSRGFSVSREGHPRPQSWPENRTGEESVDNRLRWPLVLCKYKPKKGPEVAKTWFGTPLWVLQKLHSDTCEGFPAGFVSWLTGAPAASTLTAALQPTPTGARQVKWKKEWEANRLFYLCNEAPACLLLCVICCHGPET